MIGLKSEKCKYLFVWCSFIKKLPLLVKRQVYLIRLLSGNLLSFGIYRRRHWAVPFKFNLGKKFKSR